MSSLPATTPELFAGRRITLVVFRRAVWAGRLPGSHYTGDKWHIEFDRDSQVITLQPRKSAALAKVTVVPMSNVQCFDLEVMPEPVGEI